jgi:hypothetical protein
LKFLYFKAPFSKKKGRLVVRELVPQDFPSLPLKNSCQLKAGWISYYGFITRNRALSAGSKLFWVLVFWGRKTFLIERLLGKRISISEKRVK